MNTPTLVRHPDFGLVIVAEIFRTRVQIIARDAEHVYSRRVNMQEFFSQSREVEYPQGIAVAAEKFLNPCMGIAKVAPEAQHILEDIMKTYSTKAAAKRGIIRMGGDPSTAAITNLDDGKFGVDETALTPTVKKNRGT